MNIFLLDILQKFNIHFYCYNPIVFTIFSFFNLGKKSNLNSISIKSPQHWLSDTHFLRPNHKRQHVIGKSQTASADSSRSLKIFDN